MASTIVGSCGANGRAFFVARRPRAVPIHDYHGREMLQVYLMIALGAALGAAVRYWLAGWIAAHTSAGFPWGTLIINVSGSLLIGLILTALGQRFIADPATRLLLVTGFLGAYTTFS